MGTHLAFLLSRLCPASFVAIYRLKAPTLHRISRNRTNNMKQYSSLTPERERGHGRAVEWFPPSSPLAVTTSASPRFRKKQLFAVVTMLSAAVVLVAVLSHRVKNDGKFGRIGNFQAASIDHGTSNGQNVVKIYPDIFPNQRADQGPTWADDIEADANLNLLDVGEIYFFFATVFFALKSLCRYRLL